MIDHTRQISSGHLTPEYIAWKSMRQRCLNPTAQMYRHYGGRGITICSRWEHFDFFLKDMGKRPSSRHSLGRVKNNGPYSPDNCEWQTKQTQCKNTRRNHLIKFRGRIQTLSEWSRELEIKVDRILNRLRAGWSLKKTLETPVAKQAPRR